MDDEIVKIVFDSISDGVFTVDPDCIITSFNKSAERITGFGSDYAIGRHCFDIFRTEVCHKHCPLRDTLANHEAIENVRVTIISQEGCEIPIQVSTTLLKNDDDEIVGAVEFFSDLSEIEHLRTRFEMQRVFNEIVCVSASMQNILQTLPDIAESECNVLVQGPSGSGKELIAQAIHSASPRRYGPYIRLNCAALPATLLESELFGYVKGAFTDAKRDKPGHFCLANGGTLLLDEIGEMDVSLQVKLLRVLNNGEYRPLGSNKMLRADARIIATTNSNLSQEIKRGTFREDLYFRLNVVGVDLPPLKTRPEDIPVLVDHFIRKFSTKSRKTIQRVSPAVLAILRRYSFPGNVRELENAIEHAFVMCHDETIELEHLPPSLVEEVENGSVLNHNPKSEKQIIQEALQRNNGSKSIVAQELGMHRSTLWRKIKTYGIAD